MAGLAAALAILARAVDFAAMSAARPLPQVVHVSEFRFDPRWRMATHVHRDFHEMLLILKGQITVLVGGCTLVAGGGCVLLYPKGFEHAESSTGNGELRMFCMAWDAPGRAAPDAPWSAPAVLTDHAGRIESLMRWMLDVPSPRDDRRRRALDAALEALLCELRECGSEPELPWIGRVRRHVRENLARPMRLEDLADVACMSRFHFARSFKRATGESPACFVRRLRVEAARTLLQTTPMPLRAVAPLVGFADEFQLSRVFRRVSGRSPSEWRGSKGRLFVPSHLRRRA